MGGASSPYIEALATKSQEAAQGQQRGKGTGRETTHNRLLVHATEPFKSFLKLLWMTRARPSEIASLTAEQINLSGGVAALSQHKTAHLGIPTSDRTSDSRASVGQCA